MFFILLLTLLNACINNELVNSSSLRIQLGNFPINVFDIALLIGTIYCALPRGNAYVRVDRVHPAFRWSLILFIAAMIGGLIGAQMNGATPRQITTTFRNLLAIPIAMTIGTRVTANAR